MKARNLTKLLQKIWRAGPNQVAKTLDIHLSPTKPIIKFTETKLGNYYVVSNDALSKKLVTGETHEPHFYELTKILLQRNDNVCDLGANLGTHSVWMGKLVENGKVFSFEPLGLTFSQLQLNILANKLTNIAPYRLAVSDKTGDYLQMEWVNYDSETLNIGGTRVAEAEGVDGVLSIRLDDLDLPQINFIKMDIQGSEYSALVGMSKLIQRDRPTFFIEIEEKHLRARGTSSKQLIEHLFSLDYTLLRIKTNYPCDHIAVASEKLELLEKTITNNYSFRLDKLKGKEITLTFDSNSNNYSEFIVQ